MLKKTAVMYSRLCTPSNIVSTGIVAMGTAYYSTRKKEKCTCDYNDKDDVRYNTQTYGIQQATLQAEELIKNLMYSSGCPGISIGVSINGQTILAKGYGYADLENKVPCTADTVMKIASISKPITMAMVARAQQQGLFHWSDDIQRHIDYWPIKTWNGQEVAITVQQVASHWSGIRDYKKIDKKKTNVQSDSHEEFDFEEYYIKKRYRSIEQATSLFRDDELVACPGQEYHYTTHGFTVLAALLEAVQGDKFTKLLNGTLKDLGMENSFLDHKHKIIYNRARHYVKDKDGNVANAPFTESSFKWAGAGVISNVHDLLKFANVMLNCYDTNDNIYNSKKEAPFLDRSTLQLLWTPVRNSKISPHHRGKYAMGWQIIPLHEDQGLKCRDIDDDIDNGDRKETNHRGVSNNNECVVGHTGGTIGASCALLMLPGSNIEQDRDSTNSVDDANVKDGIGSGIAVVVLSNFQGLALGPIALQILNMFLEASHDKQ